MLFPLQAIFHFRTFLDNEDRTEIDDSKRLGEPFTLIFGKKFKLEVWENMIETMRVDEIASFHCKYYVSMITEFFPIHNVISSVVIVDNLFVIHDYLLLSYNVLLIPTLYYINLLIFVVNGALCRGNNAVIVIRVHKSLIGC